MKPKKNFIPAKSEMQGGFSFEVVSSLRGMFGIELERGRENNCFPVKEGLGKPWAPDLPTLA
jgi:hypothetical protein